MLTANQQNDSYPDQQKTRSNIFSVTALTISLFFVFSIPWGNAVWDGLSRIVGMLAFAAVMLSFIMAGTRAKFGLLHLIIALFGVWLIVSFIWTPDTIRGEFLLKTTIQLLLITILITLIIDTKERVILAYKSYIWGNVVGSGIIIYNYVNGIESIYHQRYAIPNFDVDGQSIMLTLAIPMAAYIASQLQSKWMKAIYTFIIPTIVFAVFLTATRTAVIVGVIGILYWMLTYRNSTLKIKVTFFMAFVVLMIAAVSLSPQESIDRIMTSGKSISSGTLNNRTVIWGASLEQWNLSPLIGNGIGSLQYILNTKHVEYDSAHSAYIHILTENGIIGLSLYLFMIIMIIYNALYTPRDEMLFLLSLLFTILVSQIAQHTQVHKETWFVFTMLVIHAQHHRRQIE